MAEKEQLTEIAQKVLKICEKEQIAQSEVFLIKKSAVNLTQNPFQDTFQIQTEAGTTIGIAVRLLVKDNLQGFAYSSDIDKDSIREVVLGAKNNALPVKEFSGFIQPTRQTNVEKLYDNKIAEIVLEPSSLFEELTKAQNKVSDYQNMKLQAADFSAVKMDTVILNSNGLEQMSTGTFLSLAVTTALQENSELTTTYRQQVYRTINDANIESLTTEAADESLMMNKPVSVDDGEHPIILTARAAADLYGYQFETSVCLSGVQAGVSKLSDKISEQVASEAFTLYDDATMPGGQYSTPFDDEGVPTQKNIIIERGILKGYLASTIHAARGNSKSTGNSVRYADRRINNYYTRDYNYRPSSFATNLCVAPGDSSEEELVSELENGYIINLFTGGIAVTDPSGDFNIMCSHLYRVENGEIVGSINQASAIGNWFEIFKNVKLVANKQEREMSSLGATSYVWPKMLVSPMKLKKV